MMLTKENLPAFSALIRDMKAAAEEAGFPAPLMLLQLTHSGRQSIRPMIAYRNPIYEAKRPMENAILVSDEYLDTLPALYAESAGLAIEAGFDGVDIKSCHGYLLQELLSAFSREGKYGGTFENRISLYIDCIRAAREAMPKGAILSARLGASDMVKKPYGFGTNEVGALDLSETDLLIEKMIEEGVSILNITVGNPYFNPHVNRPYRVGAYTPPEAAEVGLRRFLTVEKHIKEKFPDLCLVGSGLSYYREDLIERSEALLREGACDLVGYGRVSLAYPDFYRDSLAGHFDAKKCCAACSKCTTLMRRGLVSGCAVFNEYYRNLYKESEK
jgi:2,4-dienoyl-CoA reductase-like NADH-dependent reductase (Old Yellow Enzyme family)